MTFPYKIIDLTHCLDETIPSWNGGCGFNHETKLDYAVCTTEVKFRVQQLRMHAGIGTHIDAPAHCIPGGITVEKLALNDLIAPCVMIDVSEAADERYRVSVRDIEKFEKVHGTLQPGCFVLIRTGWERFWQTPEKYRNDHIFPSIAEETAAFLVTRGIVGVGIDTLSPDKPEDGYPVHAILLGDGKYIVENAANLHLLPPVGSFTMALPIKAAGCTEAPIRFIGLIPES